MAKKDFTMKFAAPKVKGSKDTSDQKAETPEATSASRNEKDQSGETTAQGLPKSEKAVESDVKEAVETQIKEKKVKNLTALPAEPKKPETELRENPFLQSKEHFDPTSVIKTGYKMRVDYKTVLKFMAELKKGYTIEALLDDALTMYLASNPEAQKAMQMMRLMK